MKLAISAALLVTLAGVLVPEGPAFAACEHTVSEDGYTVISGTCRLAAEAEWAEAIEEIVATPLTRTGPDAELTPAVELPNLRVVDIRNKFDPILQAELVFAVVINDGPADAVTPFVVRGRVAITDAYQTGMYHQGMIKLFPAALKSVSRLRAGDTVDVLLYDNVRAPNDEEDFDLMSSAYVDWDEAQSGGAVRETNESDNLAWEHCRLYQADFGNSAPTPAPPEGDC